MTAAAPRASRCHLYDNANAVDPTAVANLRIVGCVRPPIRNAQTSDGPSTPDLAALDNFNFLRRAWDTASLTPTPPPRNTLRRMTDTLLIAGVPRSGSTWTARVLSAAPDAFLVGEPDNAYEQPYALAIKRRIGQYTHPSAAARDARFRHLWRQAGRPLARALPHHGDPPRARPAVFATLRPADVARARRRRRDARVAGHAAQRPGRGRRRRASSSRPSTARSRSRGSPRRSTPP